VGHSTPESVFRHLAELLQRYEPVLIVLVGPNGAGKSSFYQRRLSGLDLPFINADILGKELVDAGAPAGESTERLAAKLAEQRRRQMVENRESFITETVFSDPVGAKVNFLRETQNAGYLVVMIFVCVDSAQLSAMRVETRVQIGGHDVPPEKIGPRYDRMRANVASALTFVDFAILIDNSSFRTPFRPVAAVAKENVIYRNNPMPWWAEEVLPVRPST